MAFLYIQLYNNHSLTLIDPHWGNYYRKNRNVGLEPTTLQLRVSCAPFQFTLYLNF